MTRKAVTAYDCEFCKKAHVVASSLPKGWGVITATFTDCGLTDYTKQEDMDACDQCYPVEKDKRHVY